MLDNCLKHDTLRTMTPASGLCLRCLYEMRNKIQFNTGSCQMFATHALKLKIPAVYIYLDHAL